MKQNMALIPFLIIGGAASLAAMEKPGCSSCTVTCVPTPAIVKGNQARLMAELTNALSTKFRNANDGTIQVRKDEYFLSDFNLLLLFEGIVPQKRMPSKSDQRPAAAAPAKSHAVTAALQEIDQIMASLEPTPIKQPFMVQINTLTALVRQSSAHALEHRNCQHHDPDHMQMSTTLDQLESQTDTFYMALQEESDRKTRVAVLPAFTRLRTTVQQTYSKHSQLAAQDAPNLSNVNDSYSRYLAGIEALQQAISAS